MKTPADSEFVLQLLRTLKSIAEALRQCGYQTLQPGVPHACVVPLASYSPWLADAEFKRVHEAVAGSTLVDCYRMHELWQLVDQLCGPGNVGDVLEVGTWRGGTGCLMAARCKAIGSSAKVFLCDTFRGVVKTSEKDTRYKGGEHFDASPAHVAKLVEKLELDNVEVIQGVFPDESGAVLSEKQFRLCHIDVDAYLSAKGVSDWVWERLSIGGALVFDDFGFWGCEGVTRFVNDEMHRPDRLVLHNLNGHAVVVKTA